ncbi:hypothetical protein [Peribacillus frigoritolerans]|uniref:hypothetical protein n=1 Tax=Peribacillus frigoritolerans TaxID=450367 RepID=UPI0039A32E3A
MRKIEKVLKLRKSPDKRYYEKNKGKIIENRKRYYQENKERILERAKESYARRNNK